MGSHPANLALRFALELAGLVAVGWFGWARFDGVWRWVAVVALPLAFAGLWATFNVPDDPSRGGGAPVVVRGWLRLLLELALFASAVAAVWGIGRSTLAIALGATVVVHYALSWDRIGWLLAR